MATIARALSMLSFLTGCAGIDIEPGARVSDAVIRNTTVLGDFIGEQVFELNILASSFQGATNLSLQGGPTFAL